MLNGREQGTRDVVIVTGGDPPAVVQVEIKHLA